MSSYDRTPTFNLQIVVHQTGLTPDTLRVWEKRYKLPQPDRTPGGHRLYSEYDIETLRWLVARKAEGMSISRAVALWRQLEAAGRDPFEAGSTLSGQASTDTPLVTGQTVAEARQKWIAACLAFDEATAENELAQAFALYPPDDVCTEVLQKGLSEIGELWYRGQATVQQEHFASALATRRLQAMITLLPRPTRKELILVGCPPQEEHSFAALLLTLLLRYQGWGVTYLGANVPLSNLAETLADVRPDLVVMSAQHLQSAATLAETASFLQMEDIPLAFGGNIFNQIPALPDRVWGHFLGATLRGAVQNIKQLLTSRVPLPPPVETLPACHRALEDFQAHRASIEADLYRSEVASELSSDYLVIANGELGENIFAALALGDIHFADSALTWLEALLDNHQITALPLRHYLAAYRQAASANLGEAGAPIITWLEGWTERRET